MRRLLEADVEAGRGWTWGQPRGMHAGTHDGVRAQSCGAYVGGHVAGTEQVMWRGSMDQ